ncbi:unnamed protein product, partial [Brenthis ino]
MSVVIETTLGDITVDLYLEQRPITCLNFLKLCKMKYYNFNLFHSIRSEFIAQTGDPTGEGSGGQSIWGILEGPEKRFFSGEKMPKIRHTGAGLISMVCTDDMMVGSQFFITLAPDLDSLDGTHCVIGEVTEGQEILTKLNEVICDENHRPYRDVRITHTVVLEDPFSDPPGLRAPSRSPSPNPERLKGGRIAPDEEIDETQGKSAEEIQEMIEDKEAKARATILEIVGDLPDAEIAPPENVLFVCKLNPVTTDEDLEIIFSRFGKIVSCEVIRDKKTGNSLQYAFIEFENKKSCEDAYFKMDNVLIDDRRIHVDFSQSVSKMRWLGKGRGVQYFDDDSKNSQVKEDDKGTKRYRDDRHKNENRDRSKHDNYRNDRDREQRHERDRRNIRERRERSRSRIQDSRDRQKERERDRKTYSRDNQKYNENGNSERLDYKNNHSKYHRSKNSPNRSNKRDSAKSPIRNHKYSEHKEKPDNREHNKYNNTSYKMQKLENTKSRSRKDQQKNSETRNQSKEDKNIEEPKTPSPNLKRKIDNDVKKKSKDKERKVKENKKSTKHSNKKKKPRPSTSSSDSSSDSSSSTDSSSSSDSDRKKKKSRRKKRKYSTSSSSSDSSTSSSSSETSSSSSSSDSEHDKKKQKNRKKKDKKIKKRL